MLSALLITPAAVVFVLAASMMVVELVMAASLAVFQMAFKVCAFVARLPLRIVANKRGRNFMVVTFSDSGCLKSVIVFKRIQLHNF
jgi:hypothetical protein